MSRTSPLRNRLRTTPARLAALALAVSLAGSACAATDASPSADRQAADAPAPELGGTTAADRDEDRGGEAGPAAAGPGAATGDGDLAQLVTELPPAPIGFPAAADEPRPVTLTIESLGIRAAPVIDVGVEGNGDMEVPPADEVGWYRYSPTPGQAGSSILAAHIAFDGRNGVFVRLADIDPGEIVEVTDEEGRTDRFVVESVDRYDKTALPEDVVFARDGDPRLVLVTCGGRFDRERNSYDDNVVVVATPVDGTG